MKRFNAFIILILITQFSIAQDHPIFILDIKFEGGPVMLVDGDIIALKNTYRLEKFEISCKYEELDYEFQKIDTLLFRYFSELESYFKQPDFYNEYKTARIILDYGHGKTNGSPKPGNTNAATVNGKVYDLETEEGIEGVKVMLEGTDVWMLTDESGNYLLNTVKGSYRILAENTGLEPYSDDITLEEGDALELDIAMEVVV